MSGGTVPSDVVWNCIDTSSIPIEVMNMDKASRTAAYFKLRKTYNESDAPLSKPDLSSVAPMGIFEEMVAVGFYFFVIGTPLLMIPIALVMVALQAWGGLTVWLLFLGACVSYPIEKDAALSRKSWFTSTLTRILYRYSSFKVVWQQGHDDVLNMSAVGSGGPHGVFPIGATLSVPAMNELLGVNFLGASASVLFNTPGLRSLLSMGVIDVSKRSVIKAISKGHTVGIVADGINGMFASAISTGNVEVLAIGDKKGLVKLALQQGIPIHIVHWFGNSTALTPVVDPFGLCKAFSRKFKVSLMLFFGRWGLPVPHRQPIIMACNAPIYIKEKIEKPTQADIDAVHRKVVEAHTQLFNSVKTQVGGVYTNKDLIVNY